MNILFITEKWHPEGGGSAIYFYNIAKNLCLKGHKVYVITSKYKKINNIQNQNFKFLKVFKGFKNKRDFSISTLLNRIILFLKLLIFIPKIKTYNIQIIHSITPITSIIAFIIKKLLRIKVFISILSLGGHDWYHITKNKVKSLIFTLIEFLSLKLGYDKLMIISEHYRKFLLSIGIPEKKIESIPNGIDINVFTPNKSQIFRKVLKIPKDKFVLGYIGALDPIKRIDKMIDLFLNLDDRFNMIIAGDGILKDKIKNKVINYPNIYFIGQIKHELVANFMASIDVLILFSTTEGFPGVCLEALATKKPILISNEIKLDIFKDFLNYKYKIDVNKKNDFVSQIEYLYNNRNNAIKSFQTLKELIKINYSWDFIVNKLIDLYLSPFIN